MSVRLVGGRNGDALPVGVAHAELRFYHFFGLSPLLYFALFENRSYARVKTPVLKTTAV